MTPSAEAPPKSGTISVLLFGPQAYTLEADISGHGNLRITSEDPDVVVCYGGDGTLLAAELKWPGIPKVPILNSAVGHRCIRHPVSDIITHLAEGTLVSNRYAKLECAIHRSDAAEPERILTPLNEINVNKERMNSAVRYRLWTNGQPYDEGKEILGDGFIVCTPFGSTAYFSKITRGIFTDGIGIAFKACNKRVNHLVMPSDSVFRVRITRGPALLAYDSAEEFTPIGEGDELAVRENADGANILTCGPVRRLNDPF